MPSFTIKNINHTADWCAKFISPVKYVLHNKVGGIGWKIDGRVGAVLTIEDEKKALLAILKFGDKV